MMKTQKETTLKAENADVSVVLIPGTLMIHQKDEDGTIKQSVVLGQSQLKELKEMVDWMSKQVDSL